MRFYVTLFVYVFALAVAHAATYNWSGQVAGTLSYTTGNMSVSITNTNYNTLGPQNPNGGSAGGYLSPKYVSAGTINTYQGGFTNDYGMPGLVLGVDWPNSAQAVIVTITFAAPVAGPVSFNIYDINRGSAGGYDPVWIDKVTVTGTGCVASNTVMPTITGCANNQITGAGNEVIGSHGCTNSTNTVTFNTTALKTITIFYRSEIGLAAGFGHNPDPQYIIIGDITTGNTIPASITTSAPNISCTGSTTLMANSQLTGGQYVWSNNGSTPSISVNTPGTYSVTITAGDCSATASTTIGTDTVKPVVTVTPATSTITCVMLGSALTAQSPNANLAYLWNDGDTIQVNMGNTAGVYTVTVTDKANGCTASASATVSIDTLKPTGQILPPDTLSCTNPTVTLTATSPNSGVIFLWPNGLGQGASKTVSAPGMYTVLIKIVNNGCTTADTVFVEQTSSAPNANIATGGMLTCSNPTLTLQAAYTNQPCTYTWNTGATGTTLNVTQPGTYTLIVNDPVTGCADTSSATVAQNITAPNVQVTPSSATLNCSPGGVMLTAVPMTGNMYSWSTMQNTVSIQATTPGNYTVTATNPANGCTATASATVTQAGALPVVSIQTSGTINCTNNAVVLTAIATPLPNLQYHWNTGSSNVADTVYTAGTYSVTITDTVSGCATSDMVTITAAANAVTVSVNTPGQLTCTAPSATFTATATNATNFVWNTNETTAAVSVTQPGIYTVTASNSACSATATVTVTQNTQPPTVSIAPPGVITCANPSVQLLTTTSPSAVTYAWNSGEQTPGITVATANNYVVTVTNPVNGCTATSAMPVAENVTPPTLTVNNGELNCFTSIDTLTATTAGNTTLVWSTGETADFIYVVTEGVYTVTATLADNGCTATAQGSVVQNITPFGISISPSGILNEQTTQVTLTTTTSATLPTYNWNTGSTTAFITVSTAGEYTVTVTDAATGCSGSVTLNVEPIVNNNVFVPNVFTPNGDGNNDVFRIYGDLNNIAFLEIQIFNRWGEKVFESNDHHFAWGGTYKGVMQNAQVYVWQLKLAFTNGQVDELRKGCLTVVE